MEQHLLWDYSMKNLALSDKKSQSYGKKAKSWPKYGQNMPQKWPQQLVPKNVLCPHMFGHLKISILQAFQLAPRPSTVAEQTPPPHDY